MAEKCQECRFWLRVDDKTVVFGMCRRYPPTREVSDRGGEEWMVPLTDPDWMCGEFQEKAHPTDALGQDVNG